MTARDFFSLYVLSPSIHPTWECFFSLQIYLRTLYTQYFRSVLYTSTSSSLPLQARARASWTRRQQTDRGMDKKGGGL